MRGPMVGSTPSPVAIPNYLVQSILVTIFCCVPLGIPAIIFASQVNGKIAAGDIQGATESSRKAKMWCWRTFWIGLVANILAFAVNFAAGFAEAYAGAQ